MDRRGIHDTEEDRAACDVRARGGLPLSDDTAHRRSNHEQPFNLWGSASSRRVVLGETGLGRREPRVCLLFGGPCLVHALLGRGTSFRQTLGALAIARGQCESRLRLGTRSLELRKIARH
jgi:hypothetical protein